MSEGGGVMDMDATPCYDKACCVCGCVPILKATEMCIVCTTGEHDSWEDFGEHPPVPKADFDRTHKELTAEAPTDG